MNAAQLKLAVAMAADTSIDLSGVDITPLDNHETLRHTVVVPTAAVAAILRRDNPDMGKLAYVGKHYIRIDDFRPAPKTPANAIQLTRTPAKRGRKPAAVVDAGPVVETANPFDAAEISPDAPYVGTPEYTIPAHDIVDAESLAAVVDAVSDEKPLSKRELKRRAKLAAEMDATNMSENGRTSH